ncbi:MAG: hypothetical protein ABSB35_40295 [Bryobacteraceae bacterium]
MTLFHQAVTDLDPIINAVLEGEPLKGVMQDSHYKVGSLCLMQGVLKLRLSGNYVATLLSG